MTDEKPNEPATKEAKPTKRTKGYKGHRSGSRKETLRRIYDTEGEKAAIQKAEEVGVLDITIRLWIRTWMKEAGKIPPRVKKVKS